MAIPDVVSFWLLLIFGIPSIICYIFNLYYFLMDRTLRKGLHNHVIILIHFFGLLYMVTDFIWYMYYYRNHSTLISSPIFCLIWVWIDYTLPPSITILMAWASVERHILIFHQHLTATPLKCFVFHYFPLILFGIYPSIFYSIMFFVIPCEVSYDYSLNTCGLFQCSYIQPTLAMWDSIVGLITPGFVIVIFSLLLIGRVWYNKYRMGQQFRWRNYSKMLFQLLSLSALYFILFFPCIILYTAYTAGLSRDVGADFFLVALFFSYFVTLFIPFVSMAVLPELRSKMRNIIPLDRRQRNAIAPIIIAGTRRANR
ncbi:unnamed protein product [Adineta steineri]|uniref:G-protein coupled receptors family 1 profile domain-containing protein n=1 Tax=Adineta steineri TaxID=433720 RepID=A0A815ID09_9BILA|nr:unnamed protein product [Adineta steineri]CAF1600478.1 unnamed protein product [Adineta steineri]